MKISIPYPIRRMLGNPDIVDMVSSMYQLRESREQITVYLPNANRNWNKDQETVFDHESKGQLWMIDYKELMDPTRHMKYEDTNFLSLLNSYGYIDDLTITLTEGDTIVVLTKIKNIKLIAKLHFWVRSKNYIFEYGLFSLNELTGEAYCEDVSTIFRQSSGQFRTLRAFLIDKNHTLTHTQILNIFNDKDPLTLLEIGTVEKTQVYQIVKDIKRKLGVKGSKSNLFLSIGNAYKLLPEVIEI